MKKHDIRMETLSGTLVPRGRFKKYKVLHPKPDK